MKLDRIIWGVLLLFVGGVILLDNFDIIEFYWRNVWSFWPVFLIILGINILFNKNNSQTGNIISIGILVVTLTFLFFKGQEEPGNHVWWDKNVHINADDDEVWDSDKEPSKLSYAEPFLTGDGDRKAILNISGGASTYELKGETDSLFSADIHVNNIRGMKYMLKKQATDSVNTLTFKLNGKSNGLNFGKRGDKVNFYMNVLPIWDVNLAMGAGKLNFDLAKYKVRTLNFDGGAADVEIKLGDLLPITDVTMEVGMANINIEIPKNSGCRIKTKTGFSSKDFNGFTKMEDGTYETSNYKSSTKKIFINLDGGFSNFEVRRN
ncbi:DUF5668 domain-containing protein [Pedobacter sp. Du54]|uniref:LiaF transmembrane domain-containing protein n=1 Tax=Pedobacter anseongensis TaxID=3133439 RepID=UPI0030AD9FBB